MSSPDQEADPRPQWMRDAEITEADLRREAQSDAPDAEVFADLLQSVFGSNVEDDS